MFDKLRKIITLLDERSTYQRLVLVWVCWLTTWATFWCAEFATARPSADALQTAAVIASFMAPIASLQAAIFAWTK